MCVTVDVALKWLGGGFQLLGIVLTMLGVDVIRSWLAEAALEGKQGLTRRWALRREQLGERWARLRRRPVSKERAVSDSVAVSDAVSATVSPYRVDRGAISERDWLTHLDERVEGLHVLLQQQADARRHDRSKLDRRLRDQGGELRAEMFAATQRGWQLVFTGLVCSAVGTLLSMLA